jgi:hypothetical protein|nr:MAG TPA: hypothetical protein [Caudoviricetes sp.]
MQIDNIEESKILLLEIEQLFTDLDDIKKELENKIDLKGAEQEDYLHELELGNLSGLEILKVSKELIRTRKERRVLKDKLEVINTLKGYTDKYITKGIIADTRQAINNIDTLINNQQTRKYTPRVVKDLKCAKSKKE